MPAWLTCDRCGKDYLVPDEWVAEMPDVEDEYETCCPRCFDLYYKATELEKQKREAYAAVRIAE